MLTKLIKGSLKSYSYNSVEVKRNYSACSFLDIKIGAFRNKSLEPYGAGSVGTAGSRRLLSLGF